MATDTPLPTAPAGPFISSEPDEVNLTMPAARRRKRRWVRILLLALLVALLLVGAAGVAAYENPALLGPVGSVLLGDQSGTVAWNGTDPVNILVMGIDQRATEQTRTDSMIVLHVDPSSHQVKMLSVPRDLWVSIPTADSSHPYGHYKINAAYALGQPYGAGPQFAQLTVESVLGIPINYYAVLKFGGFKSVVDALGGVTVCVPQEINDPQYPADIGNGYNPLKIKAGCQNMHGTLALDYARERHSYVQQDLGRIQAQQAIMAGIEKQILSFGTLFRVPAITSAVDSAVITNLPHSALPTLAVLLGRAKGDRTQHAYLNMDGGYVTTGVSADGQDILVGNWPRINTLVANMFADPRLREEHATVQVRNGQHQAGLAAMYTNILQGAGFNTVAPSNADKNTYQRNLVIVNQDSRGADYTARVLAQVMQADVADLHLGANQPQIVAILGSDATEGS